jgi:hypothetical protein
MSPNADFSPDSTVEGGKIAFKPIPTFFDFLSERTDSPVGGSTASEKLSRVRFDLHPLYQFLTCSRIPLMIARASK